MIRYGSVCSGIEAATVAWHPLGWTPVFFAEIEKFPSGVLARHYPQVRNFGDFTKIQPEQHEPIDLLVGGTPCQSFSIAGLRGGLADDRGNLALEFLRLAQRARPRWVVWENVPGVLSSESHVAPDPCPPAHDLGVERDGEEMDVEDEYDAEELHAFQCFLAGLSELGYGFAYRVLDAQYVRVDGLERAVPQRRRRVFVVGRLGDWRRAAAVLFERESLSGNPAPRREAGKGPAGTITASTGSRGAEPGERGQLIADAYVPDIMAPSLTSKIAKGSSGPAGDEHHHLVAHALRGEGFDASEDGTGRGTPIVPVEVAGTLKACGGKSGQPNGAEEADRLIPIAFDCKAAGKNVGFAVGDVPGPLRGEGHANGHTAIAFSHAQITSPHNRSNFKPGDPAPTLAGGGQPMAVAIQERAVSENPDAGPQGKGFQEGIAYTIEARHHAQAVAFQPCIGMNGRGYEEDLCPALNGADAVATSDMRPCVAFAQNTRDELRLVGGDGSIAGALAAEPGMKQTTYLSQGWAVRRLTPVECERLQGFPDGYTDVPPRGKTETPDGPRYKALGNSMAVNVMRWIGRRIEMVERLAP